MSQSKPVASGRVPAIRQFGAVALLLGVILTILFWEGFLSGHTIFSNDGPLGALCAQCTRLPEGFFGFWQDVNWLGTAGPSAPPDVSQTLALICGKLTFSKIFVPFVMLFLGLSAWLCFRQWKFTPQACALGALAAALNSAYFSTACWGVASQPLAFGLDFLALAALADQTSPRRWLRVILAGFAVGMAVMEAFDIGAIFSVLIAVYVVYQSLVAEGPLPQRVGRGLARAVLVAACAGFIAAGTVVSLWHTQIQNVAGMEQDPATKARRWDEATQWSLPKREALGFFVPGLFGFRMDTPKDMGSMAEFFHGGVYWGAIGRDANWDRYFASGKQGSPPPGPIRFSGGGCYAGVLVVVVALWTLVQSFRKEDSVFPPVQRRLIWFWGAVALFCLVMAFGRYAPVYQFFYALPYASTIRNPAKFVHVIEMALLILFACGLNGLSRRYLQAPGGAVLDMKTHFKTWWARASKPDQLWIKGSLIGVGAALLGWLIYASSRDRLVAYLQEVTFDQEMANAIANFSIGQMKWFLLFLVSSLALVALTVSGYFGGKRAKVATVLLGLVLVLDLVRANLPWVVVWDYEQKYASNPVIDLLREKPHEHRVAVLPFTAPQSSLFKQLYDIEWKQHHWLYYNIQTLDVVMMPRPPVDYVAFENALYCDSPEAYYRFTRRWQLTNTRYLLGAAGFIEALNKEIDPIQRRFRIVTTFDVVPKPGIAKPTKLEELTAEIKPDGQCALIEFTGALPRVKLYSNWQVMTNDQAMLNLLRDPKFDPAQQVLVSEMVPPPDPAQTNQPAGTVEFKNYAPKRLELHAKASTPSILLLNDHFDPNWKVRVDGQPAQLLRCNYVMRGVRVPVGEHQVEFEFLPPTGPFYVSLVAVFLGLGLLGFLTFSKPGDTEPPPAATAVPKP